MPITTRMLSVVRNERDDETLDEAAHVIRSGGLVAFPTETVYGLGADATNPEAVARIFAAKGRPATNPLIVHVDAVEMARTCVFDWPEEAQSLANRFWPGPLTLVLSRSAIIPEIVSAGLDTVGIRVPRAEFARALIARAGRPIAAPSANRSTSVSPTLAEHVHAELNGRIELIVDNGQTSLGIESTVVDLTSREPRVLRPGPISAQELEHALGRRRVREAGDETAAGQARSPGQMAVHYAPRTRAIRLEAPGDLVGFPWTTSVALLVIGPHSLPEVPPLPNRVDFVTPEAAAHGLYRALHEFDSLGLDLIVVVPPPDRSEWRAIRDRLWRATTPAAR